MRAVARSTTTRRSGWRPLAALLAVVVLGVNAAYNAAQALGWISIGELPGEDAPGAGLAGAATFLAFLLAIVVVASSLTRPEAIARSVRQLLPLAAVAAVVIGYYTYDPYYAPSHRRYSDYRSGGETLWICFVVGAAIVTAIVSRTRPRIGMLSTFLVLLLCIPTAFLGAGH